MQSGAVTLYRGCTPVVDAQYRKDGSETPAEAIINAVSTAAGVDPLELPPLYDFIDLDALNDLIEHQEERTGSEAVLSFQIDNWNVFIRSDGRIRVCDGTLPTDPQPVFELTSA